ncbi:MAG: UDP-N-acetylmuramate dehydrogenase [Anaerolineales bacterium]
MISAPPLPFKRLRSVFGERLQLGAPLARYTAARVGGPADALLAVASMDELVEAVRHLWAEGIPFTILGGGSNVLVSDAGVRGVVLLNRAKKVRFDENVEPPVVWAESGANFGAIARQAANKGLGGLEWAAGIPGTVGGAVVGNAGAHRGDVAGNLAQAEVLHVVRGRETWPVEKLAFEYRSSDLKRNPGQAVVLSATLQLEHSSPEAIREKMGHFLARRRQTQPPGASMGSMFKNPPGDYAGRLLDAAGLKGTRVGDAEISTLHANFFINHGEATAADVYELIQLSHSTVAEKFGIKLELEIELIGGLSHPFGHL